VAAYKANRYGISIEKEDNFIQMIRKRQVRAENSGAT
jgi:hypothetical protein